MDTGDDRIVNLDRAGRAAHGLASRPYALSMTALAAAVLLSWTALVVMAVRVAGIDPLSAGPGGGVLAAFPQIPLPGIAETLLAMCLGPAGAGSGTGRFAVLSAMWFLMAVAMMLPSAAPMIRTYCEIADTAAARNEKAVHPLVLVAGYLVVWLVASLALAGLMAIAGRLRAGTDLLTPVGGASGAAVLALAGLYQFSGLKERCRIKCANPFATLFGRWSTRAPAVFRLGAEQGLWCLGCCWALMLVMLVVGVMNIFWMALLGVLAMVEKLGGDRIFTRVSGGLLLVWALALLVVSL